MQHSPEAKANALAIYETHGPAEASRQTGVPRGTISQMARRAGVTVTRSKQTAAATQAAAATRAERVATLSANLLSDAERLRTKLWEPVILTTLDGEQSRREFPEFKDQKDVLLACAIAIDKSQLLAGAATARVETIEPEQRATLGKLLELRQAS